MSAILRPHQVSLLDNIRAEARTGVRRMVAQAPTGFGKTIVAANMARLAIEQGKRVLFIAPALSLIDQTVEKFIAEGITELGVIQSNHVLTNPSRPLQIASAQTLQRRKLVPPADVVLIDEVHQLHRHYETMLAAPEMKRSHVIGLSATPWTKGLGRHFDRLVVGATTQQLIETGYLSPFKVFGPVSPDLGKVRITDAGDFHEGDLGQVMNSNGLVADIVETWKRLGSGRPTLCFAVDRAHARNLQTQFQSAGITTEYVDANTPASERNEIGGRFNAGCVDVVVNIGCLTTGIDWDVRCIIMARPTRSEMLFVQMIGRGLRTAPGKDHCLILDHSDNHARLGFVTDIHHTELDDGRPKKKAEAKPKEALPSKCPRCNFLKPPKTPACPVCEFVAQAQCKVVTREGDLVELGKAAKPAVMDLNQRRIFYSELRHLEAERGRRKGWAAHSYREKTGEFPPWSWNDDPTSTPSASTLRWVRSRMIAYARRRAS